VEDVEISEAQGTEGAQERRIQLGSVGLGDVVVGVAGGDARRKSSTLAATSSVDSERGVGISCGPDAVNMTPAGRIADGATGWRP